MTARELSSRPRLAPGCRLGENNQQRILQMPERALRLNGPSLEIVTRCDGKHTVQQSFPSCSKFIPRRNQEKWKRTSSAISLSCKRNARSISSSNSRVRERSSRFSVKLET